MKRTLFLLAAVILFVQGGCSKKPPAQDACGFVLNSEAQRVSWKNETPILVYVDSTVPSQFHNSIQKAIETWNRAVGRNILQIAGIITDTSASQNGRNVISWHTTWDQQYAKQQANTNIYWVDNKINEADIVINADNYSYSTNPMPGSVHFESLVLHELGHLLGLDHKPSAPTVMLKSLEYNYERTQLSSSDISGIKCEY
ncbi:MAG: matrixin family metalloprotease [Oligoflexia bacterium]|nr:matrixin family metalloprotease [Oligoflexia bacterium]